MYLYSGNIWHTILQVYMKPNAVDLHEFYRRLRSELPENKIQLNSNVCMCAYVNLSKAPYYHTHCAARRRYQQPFTATLFERDFDDIVERQFLPSLEFIKPCRY